MYLKTRSQMPYKGRLETAPSEETQLVPLLSLSALSHGLSLLTK
jgi:hypothetical protein